MFRANCNILGYRISPIQMEDILSYRSCKKFLSNLASYSDKSSAKIFISHENLCTIWYYKSLMEIVPDKDLLENFVA